MSIVNDFRLGTVLAIGTGNHELLLMLGLPATVSYDTVLVEVDGDETASAGGDALRRVQPARGLWAAL